MIQLIAALRPIPAALLRELQGLTLRGPRAREPLMAVLSVVLAVSTAMVLRLDDLSWAAFSSYMVMRAEATVTVGRSLMRVAGTVGGALVGMLLAPGVADEPLLLVVCLFAVSWIGLFQSLVSRYDYAWVFFGITAGLVMTEALSAPAAIVHFAATRVAEVAVGSCSSLVIASLFASVQPSAGTERPNAHKSLRGPRDWFHEESLREQWPLIEHTTRAALAVALLPMVWRLFEMTDFFETAVTSFVIMIVPAKIVHERHHGTIYERMVHRTLGCLLGSVVAIGCLSVAGDNMALVLLTLCAGIWVGHHVQIGREGVSYIGTQFVLGFLVTFIQGPGPATSILPGLERLLGIAIGAAMLCLMMLVWPLPENNRRPARSSG
jgi:uncharacterized membrane protein YccC